MKWFMLSMVAALAAGCSNSSTSTQKAAGPTAVAATAPVPVTPGYYFNTNPESEVKAVAIIVKDGTKKTYWISSSKCDDSGKIIFDLTDDKLLASEKSDLGKGLIRLIRCSTNYNLAGGPNPDVITATSNMRSQEATVTTLYRGDEQLFNEILKTTSRRFKSFEAKTRACMSLFGKTCTESDISLQSYKTSVDCSIKIDDDVVPVTESRAMPSLEMVTKTLSFRVIQDKNGKYKIVSNGKSALIAFENYEYAAEQEQSQSHDTVGSYIANQIYGFTYGVAVKIAVTTLTSLLEIIPSLSNGYTIELRELRGGKPILSMSSKLTSEIFGPQILDINKAVNGGLGERVISWDHSPYYTYPEISISCEKNP